MLACGCRFAPGVPISPAQQRDHLKHTLESMFVWEIMVPPGGLTGSPIEQGELSAARIAYVEALERRTGLTVEELEL